MISSPKISVKDSFDDDEMSDDVEDEVFIRDGKNGFKFDDEIGVKRPLMAPRRKFKYNNLHSPRCKRPFHIGLRIQCNYGITFIAIFLGVTLAVVIIFNLMSSPLDQLRQWAVNRKIDQNIVPCSDYKNQHIWEQSFFQLKTEAALTTFDANDDSILDIVVGFSTGYLNLSHRTACLYLYYRSIIPIDNKESRTDMNYSLEIISEEDRLKQKN